MKINSNTFSFEKEEYKKLENIIKKIASENEIKNVSGVNIKLSQKEGTINFSIKKAQQSDEGWVYEIDDLKDILINFSKTQLNHDSEVESFLEEKGYIGGPIIKWSSEDIAKILLEYVEDHNYYFREEEIMRYVESLKYK